MKAHSVDPATFGISSERIVGSRIADVLLGWDEESRQWMERSPVIIRLEACDLLIAIADQRRLALQVGSFDTEKPPHLPSSKHPRGIGDEKKSAALRWESYRPLSPLIGERIERLSLVQQRENRPPEITIRTENMGSVHITVQHRKVVIEAEALVLHEKAAHEDPKQKAFESSSPRPFPTNREPAPSTWSIPVRFHDPSEVIPVLAS
ncbi:hypothetical protein [Raoultibacter massiliensis]|uniref:hypothetical protein n=1 Tax=Raoultibacter massiliensis TaxID=1852371 RepID=UPI000C8370C3|nr:hypothetical protein [Raoultibacter massiliensis]